MRLPKVLLRCVPDALLRGLPAEDQVAIEAAVGTLVYLEGFDEDGRAELTFCDAMKHIHTIWVEPSCIETQDALRPAQGRGTDTDRVG